jgi:MFS superfamily sulfate permease-like transporter
MLYITAGIIGFLIGILFAFIWAVLLVNDEIIRSRRDINEVDTYERSNLS